MLMNFYITLQYKIQTQNTVSSYLPSSNSIINIYEFMIFNGEKSDKNNTNTIETYYEKWLRLIKQNYNLRNKRKNSSPLVLDEPSKTIQIKSKYFAAWRKFIQKKRKQQQQTQSANISFTKQSSTLQLYSSSENINKTKIISFGERFGYDLNLKWIRYCLFCPRFYILIFFNFDIFSNSIN